MIVAVGMVKDEADIVEVTVSNLAAQVDLVIVADNGSTDGTRDILADLAGRMDVLVLDDPEPGYFQSEKMTNLAQLAGEEHGATWVVPFDADEVWYSPFGSIREVLSYLPAGCHVAAARVYDHMVTALDPDESDPTVRMGWRRVAELPLPKVAARWRSDLVIHQGNHAVSYEIAPAVLDGQLVIRHFPYRSEDQFLRKVRNGAAAYVAAGDRIPADMGAHWRQWGRMLDERGEEAVLEVFRTWYRREEPRAPFVLPDAATTLPPLIFDPAPRWLP